MDYRIENTPAFTLKGRGFRTSSAEGQSYREIPAFWSSLMEDGTWAALEAATKAGSRLGICAASAEFDISHGDFLYLVGVEATEGRDRLPEGWRHLAVPEST